MEKQDLKKQQDQNFDKWDKLLVNYVDMMVRSLIAFFLSLIFVSIVLVGFFKLSNIWIIPIVFLFSFSLSPFLSRIRLGEKFKDKYINFLKIFIK